MFRKILAAIDQSELSKQVLQQAIALAKANQANLMLVYVQSPLEDTYPNPIFSAEASLATLHADAIRAQMQEWEALERYSLEFLQACTAQATAAGIPTEFTQALGNPGRAICQLAHTWDADLIMLGRRGLSGISELFLGSVSNYVLHHAPCSVLAVQAIAQNQDNAPEAAPTPPDATP